MTTQLTFEGDEEPRWPTSYIAQRIVAVWVAAQAVRPSGDEIKKQGAAARRIAKRPIQSIALALVGIELLYPYSDGAPWDLFDLERLFSKAVQAGATKGEGGRQRDRERILAAIRERRKNGNPYRRR